MLRRVSWKISDQWNGKKERKIGASIPYENRSKDSVQNTSSANSNLSSLLIE